MIARPFVARRYDPSPSGIPVSAERASWIWASGRGPRETAFLRFSLEFRHRGGALRFGCTADQRYQLFLDGVLISCGPDRCDVANWSLAMLEIDGLKPGRHRLEANVWYIAEDSERSRIDPDVTGGRLARVNPPMAQTSWRSGFLVVGDRIEPSVLDTGVAPWRVADVTNAIMMRGPTALGYHDVGPSFEYDLSRWHRAAAHVLPAHIARKPHIHNIFGVMTPGWVLKPAMLPEQRREAVNVGRVRAVRPISSDDKPWRDGEGPCSVWQTSIDLCREISIPPRDGVEVLIDLCAYRCGYPLIEWSGGKQSRIEWSWAESLFQVETGEPLTAESPRGHRGEVDDKRWLGFGDAWIASGAAREIAPALWWRSGRYVRLRIRTGDEALSLHRIAVMTTGYPLRRAWKWRSSDRQWDRVMKLLARGLELGAHETWVDCPFYEQMMYVGDTALHALSNYVGYRDDRLTRRALDLFDASRAGSPHGLVAERYPSAWRQESATYAMLWPGMVRDFMLWRGDIPYVQRLLPAVRQLLESLLALRGRSGLLGVVPGWPFIDWVPAWNQGCGPGVREGDSSIVNLHLVLALQAAGEIEQHAGERMMAARWTALARELSARIWHRYGDAKRGVILDTATSTSTSEHAQSLALLTNVLPAASRPAAIRALVEGSLDAQATIYFSFYVLEALSRARQSDAFFQRLAFWRALPKQGFLSLPEAPDPCRSDCHGWGAHPLYHTFASIAGIRPLAPGMSAISIRPMPGPLATFRAEVVHPRGRIAVDFRRDRGAPRVRVDAPAGVNIRVGRPR